MHLLIILLSAYLDFYFFSSPIYAFIVCLVFIHGYFFCPSSLQEMLAAQPAANLKPCEVSETAARSVEPVEKKHAQP